MSWVREQGSRLGTFWRGGFYKTVRWCALGMLLGAAAGFGVTMLSPALAEQVLASFMEQIASTGTIDEEGNLAVAALLMNNWRAMLVSAAYGIIPFIFLPAISLAVNGAVLGVLGAWYMSRGMSMLAFFAGILPHGVLELPALLLSTACGITLCRNMCRLVTGNPDRRPMLELLEDLLRVLVLLVAPMTVAAAFIECYVTPVIMGLFL